ncbi:MAG: hypothetical protein M1587_08790 [Thaumarchaeota archaeon]|nr:hypothetical protein [Nitrososphaerota archaeon]
MLVKLDKKRSRIVIRREIRRFQKPTALIIWQQTGIPPKLRSLQTEELSDRGNYT